MTVFNFTTGPTQVPEIGRLEYNKCKFSPLFASNVSSKPVPDNARRTIKLVEHTITVEGYVTMPGGLPGTDNAFGEVFFGRTPASLNSTMTTLYELLTAQGGQLIYEGRALDIKATPTPDVAWGPVPEMLEFQPLGGGHSAKVTWRCTVRMPQPAQANVKGSIGFLQLNYDSSVSYDEAGFSSISIKGTMEIPMTRAFQGDRLLTTTVDASRRRLEDRILRGIDLGRFHITNRRFEVSRDKRTLEFDVMAEEKPYMDFPPDCTVAGGSYNVRHAGQKPGLINWICTLRATYTVVAGRPRKIAWIAFLALMFTRMQQSKIVRNDGGVPVPVKDVEVVLKPGLLGGVDIKVNDRLSPRPIFYDFSIDEGLYKDSRTVSFSASWRLICPLSQILIGAGVWRKVPEGINAAKGSRDQANNLWARSMTLGGRHGNIMGAKSWLENRVDPRVDVVVDLGATSLNPN